MLNCKLKRYNPRRSRNIYTFGELYDRIRDCDIKAILWQDYILLREALKVEYSSKNTLNITIRGRKEPFVVCQIVDKEYGRSDYKDKTFNISHVFLAKYYCYIVYCLLINRNNFVPLSRETINIVTRGIFDQFRN